MVNGIANDPTERARFASAELPTSRSDSTFRTDDDDNPRLALPAGPQNSSQFQPTAAAQTSASGESARVNSIPKATAKAVIPTVFPR
jgi:hypothetical protein